MPYSITTKDGITIDNIPDNIDPNDDSLKQRVSELRAGKGQLEAKPELEGQVLAEGQPVPEGYETYHDPMQGTVLRKIAPERTTGDVVKGVGETALTLGTGATGGAVGHIAGVLKGIADSIRSGKYGTEEGAKLVEQTAQDLAQSLTYTPRTEAGQEYTQAAAETLAPLEALGPLGAELEIAARGIRPTAAAARKTTAIPEAERAGIDVMTSDVIKPETFGSKVVQTVGERIPYAGTGGKRVAQQAQRAEAIKNFVEESAGGSVALVDDVMKNLSDTRKRNLEKFIDLKQDSFKSIEGKAIPTPNATKTINSELSRLDAMKTESVNPLKNIFTDLKQALQEQDIVNIEALRKQLGNQLKDPANTSISTEGQKSASAIYRSLNDDIGNFLKENGEPKDFNKWKIANKNLSEMQNELSNNTLKSVLNKGEATPEDVKKLLFSKKPSDIRILYKNLSNDGRASARAAILDDAFQKAGGIDELSTAKFSSNMKRLQETTGIFFKGDDKKALDGLTKALALTKRAEQASFKPNTGAELSVYAVLSIASHLFGGDPMTTITATAGIGGLARLYESKPVRNLLIKLSNAPKAKQTPIYQSIISTIEAQKQKEEK